MIKNNVLAIQKAEKVAEQYSLWQILGIWALVSMPMALLAWVVAPAIIPYIPLHPGIVYWGLMIVGMAWQFLVSLVIAYRELGTLHWKAIRQRTWLNPPIHPGTNQPDNRLYWWLLPCLLFSGLVSFGLGGILDAPMSWLFPAFSEPAYADISKLADPQFTGQWYILGMTVVSCLLNYFLGEEFLFRGILLPRMKGVFGRWDWVANAILFGLYHLHIFWEIPSCIVSSLATTWPASRFRSNWMAVIVHGVEGIPLFIMVMAVLLGFIS